MSDNTESHEHEAPAHESAAADEVKEHAEPAVVETEQHTDAKNNGSEVPAHPVEESDEAAAATASSNGGDANGDASKSEEEEATAAADEDGTAAANSRKRKASDSGDAVTDATEEKRPTAEATKVHAAEDSEVHPDADMPLPDGDGPAAAAIKTKTVEDVQASTEATV